MLTTGLISGTYDAKKGGFSPGGASLHNMMTPHGPDGKVLEAATNANLVPVKIAFNDLAFMFETNKILSVAKWATEKDEAGANVLQSDYSQCWQNIKRNFNAAPN
jgi:homogentisate 1,2-dioxygenase